MFLHSHYSACRCSGNVNSLRPSDAYMRFKLTIIGSDNGLSPGRRQAIIWTNAGILLIGPLGTNFIEILIGIQTFSFKKMHLKMSSAKWHPFCLGLNALRARTSTGVTGPLCGECPGHRWIPCTKASDAELWCFLWSAPWIIGWVNNREAGDLRRHRAHYDVIVMSSIFMGEYIRHRWFPIIKM